MAKTDTSQWDITATNNADVGGINIAEGMAAAGVNNAMREIMAQIAAARTGADTGIVTGTAGASGTLAGWNADGDLTGATALDGATVGATTPSTGAFTTLTASGDSTFANVSVSGTFSATSGIQESGNSGNAITFGADSQTFQTDSTTRMDITDSGVQFGGSGARITTIATTVTDDDTIGVTGGAVVDYVASGLGDQLFGVGQTWQDMSGSRVAGTSYQNTTSKPIMASVLAGNASASSVQVSTDDATWVTIAATIASGQDIRQVTFVVPPDHYYRLSNAGTTISIWAELR